ncbi:MAG: hypothetical protein IPQ13_09955 [Holophagaceae bacterium]|nr:hypothetical protein [Holophagaceae bacterium]
MDTIPSLLGTTLSGRAFRIPEDLPATSVALIFGFDHEARHDVAAWKRFFTEQGIDFISVPITPIYIPAEAMSGTARAMKARVSHTAWDSIVQVHKGGAELLAYFKWHPDHFAKVLLMAGGKVRASYGSGPFSEAAAETFRVSAF